MLLCNNYYLFSLVLNAENPWTTNKILRSFGTHDGTFHADEVTACALLVLFHMIDKEKIYRTRDVSILSQCEYVCDVGGEYNPHAKHFDHHQVGYQGGWSSAGMILHYLKEISIITPNEYQFFNESLVIGVDACDNGKEPQYPGYCSYSEVIANFAPIPHDPSEEEQAVAFAQALDFVIGHLDRLLKRYRYIQSCRDVVEEAMRSRKELLMFDKGIPWQELLL